MPFFTATRSQVTTYLLGVCPFSIAFLVFLNSSVSFVITDLIGHEQGVGDAVGNLGFADELVALIACPFWGLLSDRIGLRTVCVIGYAVVCIALVVFVQAKNVYPQLLLARLFFSIGGAAASTMVTAVLPAMSYIDENQPKTPVHRPTGENRHAHAASVASELTITPARFHSATRQSNDAHKVEETITNRSASTSKVAGFVGMFTGFGALLALFLFLPLPATFQSRGYSPVQAIQFSYYIVAAVALALSIACFLGLNNLKSESNKGWRYLMHGTSTDGEIRLKDTAVDTARNLYQALLAGFRRSDIGIGYLGGFVARASSVGISLFIPLLVNALFSSSGLCKPLSGADDPTGLPDLKRKCPRAYIVAAELTGVAETVALVTAPLFGYWCARTERKNVPLVVASVAGIVGYPLFAARFNPDDSKKADRAIAFVAVCLIGFSQIGAIVCSLASLSTGVLMDAQTAPTAPPSDNSRNGHVVETIGEESEAQPLLSSGTRPSTLSDLKGSVAGVYSFYGGAAILFLTKAGGALFDSVSKGIPFYIMAAFNGVLLVATVVLSIKQHHPTRRD